MQKFVVAVLLILGVVAAFSGSCVEVSDISKPLNVALDFCFNVSVDADTYNYIYSISVNTTDADDASFKVCEKRILLTRLDWRKLHFFWKSRNL